MSHHQSNRLTMNKISTLLFLIFLTCTSGVFADSGSSISLNGTWELSYWMQPEEPITSPKDMQLAEVKHLSAQVPGNVELDLMAANLIKDPMIGSNVIIRSATTKTRTTISTLLCRNRLSGRYMAEWKAHWQSRKYDD